MTREEAIARVSLYAAPDKAPTVTPEEVGQVVDAARTADVNGLPPGGTGYVDTWDLNAAIAAVWAIKAARCAGDFNFSADGASYSKADILAHCLEMEAQYLAKSRTGGLGTIQVIGTNGPFNRLDTLAEQIIP
jgi:hypothetical protein